jgi:hypothetical protein
MTMKTILLQTACFTTAPLPYNNDAFLLHQFIRCDPIVFPVNKSLKDAIDQRFSSFPCGMATTIEVDLSVDNTLAFTNCHATLEGKSSKNRSLIAVEPTPQIINFGLLDGKTHILFDFSRAVTDGYFHEQDAVDDSSSSKIIEKEKEPERFSSPSNVSTVDINAVAAVTFFVATISIASVIWVVAAISFIDSIILRINRRETLKSRLREKYAELEEKDAQLQEKDAELEEKDAQLQEKDAELEEKDAQLQEKDAELEEKDAELEEKDAQLQEKDAELEETVKRSHSILVKVKKSFQEKIHIIQEREQELKVALLTSEWYETKMKIAVEANNESDAFLNALCERIENVTPPLRHNITPPTSPLRSTQFTEVI